MSRPWKWDVTTYDRPGWKTLTDNHQQLRLLPDCKTWSEPERTPMWGVPPNPILLKSGAILCTYTHRRAPFGIRACLSYDEGKTWDIGNEKILRDDATTRNISYPTAVQLEDGSIFASYATNKPVPPLPDDEKTGGADVRFYAAGTRFSEDFVRAYPGRHGG